MSCERGLTPFLRKWRARAQSIMQDALAMQVTAADPAPAATDAPAAAVAVAAIDTAAADARLTAAHAVMGAATSEARVKAHTQEVREPPADASASAPPTITAAKR